MCSINSPHQRGLCLRLPQKKVSRPQNLVKRSGFDEVFLSPMTDPSGSYHEQPESSGSRQEELRHSEVQRDRLEEKESGLVSNLAEEGWGRTPFAP
jgi:hypothetical protein